MQTKNCASSADEMLQQGPVNVSLNTTHERGKLKLQLDTHPPCCVTVSVRSAGRIAGLTLGSLLFSASPYLYGFVAFAMDVVLLTR